MSAPPVVLLDSSYLIALERETRRREHGPALAFLPRLRGRKLVVSVVSVEELLEGVDGFASAQRQGNAGRFELPFSSARATRRLHGGRLLARCHECKALDLAKASSG